MSVESKLDRVIELLEGILEVNSKRLENESADANPWPFTLASEMATMEDRDGNGMVYGVDFVIGENPSNVPPALVSAVVSLEERGLDLRRLSWEQYLETLPEGQYRNKVTAFVSSLAARVTSR